MLKGGNCRELFQRNCLHSSAWIKEHHEKNLSTLPKSEFGLEQLNLRSEIIVRLKYKTQFTGTTSSEPFLRTRWALSWSRNNRLLCNPKVHCRFHDTSPPLNHFPSPLNPV